MEPLNDEVSLLLPAERKFYFPARYVFAGVAMLGGFLNVLLGASLPVAITAMVRRNSSNEASKNTTQTDKFDWDEVTQSHILTAAGYGTLCSCLLGARIAELWSPKLTIAISNVMGASMSLLLPITAHWSVTAVIVTQVIGGFFGGPTMPVMMAMFSSWFPPDERQQLGGLVFSSSIMAGILSNVITGKLADTIGWQFIFYLFPSLVVTWTLLWMLLVFDSPETHPRISEEEFSYITRNTKKDQHQTTSKCPWKEILLSPAVWAYLIMVLPGVWVAAMLGTALPTYMTNILGYTTTQAGYYSAIPQVFSWISTVTFGFLSQWIRKKEFVSHLVSYHIFNGISTLGTAAALFSVLLVDHSAVEVISLTTLAMTCMGAFMGGSQLNHMDLSVNYTGTLAGLSTMAMGMMGILAPTITGILTNKKQTLSAWNNVFCVAASVNIIPFIVYLFFGSVDEQPWNKSRKEDRRDYAHLEED